MDLRKRFVQRSHSARQKNRILVVELENKLIGLIVQLRFGSAENSRLPKSKAPGSVFADSESNYVTGVGKLKGRLIILLEHCPSSAPARIPEARGGRGTRRDFKVTLRRVAAATDFRITQYGHDHSANSAYRGRNLSCLQTLVYQECGMVFDDAVRIS